MSISLIKHIAGFGKDSAVSLGIDTTGASLLVMAVGWQSGVAITVTDSKGNTWYPLANQSQSPIQGQIYYAWNPTVGAGHTFTVSGTGAFAAFEVGAFAGVLTTSNPFDVQTGGPSAATQFVGVGSGNLVPSVDNELIINMVAFNPAISGFNPGAGFAAVDFVNMASGANYGSAMNYLVQTTKATISNATTVASWTTAVPVVVNSATFKYDPAYVAQTPVAPGAPTIGTATPGDTTASFPFAAPGSNGNATIDTYQLTVYKASDNSPVGTFNGTASPIVATGLANGVGVYGKIAAHNSAGYGTQSAASNTVTPTTAVPASPTITGVAVSPTSANLTPGQTRPFAATVSGTGAYNSTVTWTGNGVQYLDSTTANNVTFTAPATLGTYTLSATASDGSHVASATITVAAASGVITPPTSGRNPNPQDRVIDSTNSTGAGPVSVASVTATGYRTLAVAYPAGGKGVTYVIESSDKSQWEAGLGTYTVGSPGTLYRDTVLSSSNAGNAVNFAPGTKTIYCDLSARSAAVFAVKDYIDLRDYDVDPTFTADSSAGIQAAIQKAWDTRTSRIKLPDGHFKVAVAPTVSGAQIWIPNSKSTDQMRTIIFEGAAMPNLEVQGLVEAPVPTNGTIIESTYLSTSGGQSLLRGEAGWSGEGALGRWNYTNVGFRNIGFRTKGDNGTPNATTGVYPTPNMLTALNLYEFSHIAGTEDVRIDVNVPIIYSPNPTGTGSTGIIMPKTDNHANMQLKGVTLVAGFETALYGTEHTQVNKLSAIGCVNAYAGESTNHGSVITHLHVECCKNSMVLQGTHPLGIVTYSSEHNTDGHWFDFVSDLKWGPGSSSSASAVVTCLSIQNSTVIKSHVGRVNEFIVAGLPAGAVPLHKILVGAGAN